MSKRNMEKTFDNAEEGAIASRAHFDEFYKHVSEHDPKTLLSGICIFMHKENSPLTGDERIHSCQFAGGDLHHMATSIAMFVTEAMRKSPEFGAMFALALLKERFEATTGSGERGAHDDEEVEASVKNLFNSLGIQPPNG